MTNEILNFEQLDGVSGGNINDRSFLALFFKCYLLQNRFFKNYADFVR